MAQTGGSQVNYIFVNHQIKDIEIQIKKNFKYLEKC